VPVLTGAQCGSVSDSYHAPKIDARDVLKHIQIYANKLMDLDEPGGTSGELVKKADTVD